MMVKCDYCRKATYLPFSCKHCNGTFCEEHRLPEAHKCPKTYLEELTSLKPTTIFKAIKEDEYRIVEKMDREFDQHLEEIIQNRLDETIKFGRNFSAIDLAVYLVKNFGKILFFDPLLTLAQQYAIADVEIVNEAGSISGRTGFNLALFGDPGTGKTFAAKDFIIGDPEKGIPAHGLLGRNRYCGGMTPARFIKIGRAYEGKKFVFIVRVKRVVHT
jgi:hypothetical protein